MWLIVFIVDNERLDSINDHIFIRFVYRALDKDIAKDDRCRWHLPARFTTLHVATHQTNHNTWE